MQAAALTEGRNKQLWVIKASNLLSGNMSIHSYNVLASGNELNKNSSLGKVLKLRRIQYTF
jgi:hypothetical protein